MQEARAVRPRKAGVGALAFAGLAQVAGELAHGQRLTDVGLRERLAGLVFVKVLTSPLQRAKRTCELAGFGAAAEVDPDLVEWNYGDYEGVRTAEIRKKRPDWELFRDGCPNGESPVDVTTRADRVVARTRAFKGNVLIFSSGHFLRMFAARWLGLEPLIGKYLILDTASLSALSYEHDWCDPTIRYWNNTRTAVAAG